MPDAPLRSAPRVDHATTGQRNNPLSLATRIAVRYVGAGRFGSGQGQGAQLVNFMSLLTIGGLTLSVAILVTVLSVMNGFDREVRENVLGVLPHASISTDEKPRTAQWSALQQQLKEVPGVVASTPVLEANAVVASERGSRGVLANGIDPVQEAGVSRLGEFMVEGSLGALSEQRFQLVLGQSLARQLGVGLGDTVTVYSLNVSINPVAPLPVQRRFTVAGIFRVGTQELDEQLIMMNLADAQALYRQPDSFNSLRLRSDDVLQVNRLREHINPLLSPGYHLQTWTQWFGAIYENIRLSRTIVGLLLWLLVAVAAFNLIVSLVMIVRDKRGDIAILRTMGASPATIGRIFVLQGCLIGLIGTALGLILGCALALSISDLFAWFEQISGTTLLSADVYPVDFLPSQLRWQDIVGVSLGVWVLCLLASLYPAWRAARVLPAQALRAE